MRVLLTTGETVTGNVVVFRPTGHDRLSDYAQVDEKFRYLELEDRTLLINSSHIVALTEVSQLSAVEGMLKVMVDTGGQEHAPGGRLARAHPRRRRHDA